MLKQRVAAMTLAAAGLLGGVAVAAPAHGATTVAKPACTATNKWVSYPKAATKYAAGTAGTVTIAPRSGHTLKVAGVTKAAGWTASTHQGAGKSLEVLFRKGSKRVTFDADVEDGGRVRIVVVSC